MSPLSRAGLIEPKSDDQVIWRYLSYPKLLSLLTSKELRFTRADCFTDPLEGYLPRETMLSWMNKAQNENEDTARAWNWGDEIDLVEGLMRKNPVEVIQHQRKLGFVSCWNADSCEKRNLWEDYTPGSKGVVIKSSVGRLKEAIEDIPQENLSIGETRYLDFEAGDNFIPRGFTKHPLAYKHTKFEDEREIRAIVFQRGPDEGEFDLLRYNDIIEDKEDYLELRRSASVGEPGMDNEYCSNPLTTGVDVEKLIAEIRVSPFGSGWQQGALDQVISNEFELGISVEDSMLDIETKPDKPSVDIDPGNLYSDIEDEEFLTLNDLAKINYELD